MAHRTKLIEIDLGQPLTQITALQGIATVQAIVKLHGTPLGWIWVSVEGDQCSSGRLRQAIFPQFQEAIVQQLIETRLHQPGKPWDMPSLLALTPVKPTDITPITIALCVDRAMDRPEDIEVSIQALTKLPNSLQTLVVEALPPDDRTQTLATALTYHSTQTPGRNAARNAATEHATGEVIAFLQPGSLPSVQWAETLGDTFSNHPDLQALTGLVTPESIDRESQAVLDRRYSPSRGLHPKIHSVATPTWMDLGTMQVGSGLNMAFRRGLFDRIGRFDPALDQPGLTWGGGDLDLFARILLSGEQILYCPAVHLSVRFLFEETPIRRQLNQAMTGIYSYFQAGRHRFPNQPWNQLSRWKSTWLMLALLRSWGVPRRWILAEIQGALTAKSAYRQALSRINAMAPNPVKTPGIKALKPMAVRDVDIDKPLPNWNDLAGYAGVKLYIRQGDRPIGHTAITTNGKPLSAAQIARAIAQGMVHDLLAIPYNHNRDQAWSQGLIALENHWQPTLEPLPKLSSYPKLDIAIPVSIIITTCDRPDDLRQCLKNLMAQQTSRSIEIIVADNRPASGLSKTVVAEFPTVRYLPEPRAGGSYGRNAAFVASRGDIVVTVDDDVTVPSDWLEKLIKPLCRPEVMVVTGNVLPLELETPAQVMFETLKGGLGEGFVPFEAQGKAWLDAFLDRSPPTWDLGVSANAAFRASIFHHPQIGMMDEVLGPGTPTVGGEENHLIYKVLRAGYTVVYHPEAYVWHRHRREMKAFYKQVYGHMKGGTAYHLLLWLQEKDLRGRDQLLIQMPLYLKDYFRDRLLQRHKTPWRLMWSEVSGYLAGFWGYKQSVDRVKQLGRSNPYIPPTQRGLNPLSEIPTQMEPTPETPINSTP
jgi:O-antigen biosynthesis protein